MFIQPVLTESEVNRLRVLLEQGSRADYRIDRIIDDKLVAAVEAAKRPRFGRTVPRLLAQGGH